MLDYCDIRSDKERGYEIIDYDHDAEFSCGRNVCWDNFNDILKGVSNNINSGELASIMLSCYQKNFSSRLSEGQNVCEQTVQKFEDWIAKNSPK